jgi:hypothetical protein
VRVVTNADQYQAEVEPDAPGPELVAGTKLSQGTYTIIEHLKSGGFGITYLASDTLGRRVVIKECFPSGMCSRPVLSVRPRSRAYASSVSDLIERFVAEAHSLAKVSHPNIVKVHQVFKENGTAYMALDYVEGHDLLDIMGDPSIALTPAEVRSSLVKLLDAIGLVHSTGLLHRDISPDNILIDGNRNPVLIDFGAAREQTPTTERAASTLRVVKDGYSPHELYIGGGEQGPWSDLYSLAASFYHLISREAPPNSQMRLAAMATQSEDPCTPLAGRFADYDAVFLAAIDKAMSILPRDRIQSSQEWMSTIAEGDSGKMLLLSGVGTTRTMRPQSGIAAAEDGGTVSAGKRIDPKIMVGAAAVVAIVATAAYLALPGRTTVESARDQTENEVAAPAVSTEPADTTQEAAPAEPAETPIEEASAADTDAGAGTSPVAEADPVEVDSVASDWTVELPITGSDAQPNKIGEIVGVVPSWLAPGVQILSVNGIPVDRIDGIVGALRQSTDPGNAANLTVTMTTISVDETEAVENTIDLPLIYITTLGGGTMFRTRTVGDTWQTEVMALPAGYEGELRVGDVVIGDANRGTKLEGPDALKDLLEAEIAQGAEIITLAVQRSGQMWVAPLSLPKRDQ